MRSIYFTLFIVFSIISCSEKEPDAEIMKTGLGVYIINEGNFQWENGSLSFYHFSDSILYEDVFFNANGEKIGDIPQSMYIIDSIAYIVVNNSAGIEKIRLSDNKRIDRIEGLVSPRYFCPVNSTKAYVSDLYSNSIQVIDLKNNIIINSIATEEWIEEMVFDGKSLFACQLNSSKVLKINILNDEIESEINLAENPNSIVTDSLGNIWVLCGGKWNFGPGQLFCVNPENNQIIKDYSFPVSMGSPQKLRINGSGSQLYFIATNIYSMAIDDVEISTTPYILSVNQNFYGLGISPVNGNIYVSDAKDYLQRGDILVYNSMGEFLHLFKAGIIPGFFCFLNNDSIINKNKN